jgi:hypothetical protein
MTSTVTDVMLQRLPDWGVESIVRGDSDRVDVIKEGVKSKVQEFLPGRGGDS